MKTIEEKLIGMPEQVCAFVRAMVENARTDPDWAKPDLEGGLDFASTIPYVHKNDDGSVTVSDNYERFFSAVYTYHPDGRWTIRRLYSEMPDKPYSYEQAMGDASIMFTG